MPDPLTDHDKVRVACELLRMAPPGEFQEVFSNIRDIVHNDQLLQEKAMGSFIAYDEDMFTPVALPDGRKTLVTKHGRLGLGLYVDPATNSIFKFDHVKKEASGMRANERNALYELTEPDRRIYEIDVAAYVAKHFPAGNFAVYAKNVQSEEGITICIEDHKFASTNFYNGLWRSEWHLTPTAGTLTGTMRLGFHYFEDGNVHLSSRKEAVTTLKSGDTERMSKQVIEFIRKSERSFQQAQLAQFTVLADESFKSLRRALPASRCRLDWTQLVHYEIGRKIATRGTSSDLGFKLPQPQP